jgi:hypothetical protein
MRVQLWDCGVRYQADGRDLPKSGSVQSRNNKISPPATAVVSFMGTPPLFAAIGNPEWVSARRTLTTVHVGLFPARYAVFLQTLKAAREKAGLTQAQLAKRLGETQTFVSKCERGERRIDDGRFRY